MQATPSNCTWSETGWALACGVLLMVTKIDHWYAIQDRLPKATPLPRPSPEDPRETHCLYVLLRFLLGAWVDVPCVLCEHNQEHEARSVTTVM